MSGRTLSLKPNRRLVIDTHVLVTASEEDRAQAHGGCAQFLKRVLDRCSRFVVSPAMDRELRPRLAEAGFAPKLTFLPALSPLFRELEDKGKILAPKKSRIKELTAEQAELLQGHGHANITDDEHLLCAALTFDRQIVTEDPNILERAELFRTELGIEIAHPDDAQ